MKSNPSLAGHVHFVCGQLCTFRAWKLPFTAVNTMESELCGASDAAKTVIWLKKLYEQVLGKSCGTVPIYIDNAAGKANSQGSRKLRTVRHIGMNLRFLQEQVHQGVVFAEWIPGKENPADLMTKNVKQSTFEYLLPRMMKVVDEKK